MNTLSIPTANMNNHQSKPRQLDAGESRHLKERIENDTKCEVLFSRFDLGRYATDASHYQIFPLGVVIPRVREDLSALIEIAKEFGICLTGRGGWNKPKRPNHQSITGHRLL